MNVRRNLARMVNEAHENLEKKQDKMKTWYDQKSRVIEYEEGEEVLVLLPTSAKSLEAEWQGPFKITRKVSDTDYEVDTGRSRKKLGVYHVNLLKKWRSREEVVMFTFSEPLVDESSTQEVVLYETRSEASWKDVELSEKLSENQKSRLQKVMVDSFS